MQTQTQETTSPASSPKRDLSEAMDIINDSYRLAYQTVSALHFACFEIIQASMPEGARTEEYDRACWVLEMAQEKAEATLARLAEWEWNRPRPPEIVQLIAEMRAARNERQCGPDHNHQP